MSGLALLLLLQARAPLGTFDGWGAFRDPSPLRCFAIARPVEKHANAQPFASVATWPRDGVRNQLHIRLSRARAPDARVTLSIGERRFELQAGDADAWAPDARTDAAIVAAMRAGRSMSVETMGANGAPFADGYALGVRRPRSTPPRWAARGDRAGSGSRTPFPPFPFLAVIPAQAGVTLENAEMPVKNEKAGAWNPGLPSLS